jgi:hypothetical protein
VREVQLEDVVDPRTARDLLVGRVADVEQDGLARVDLDRGLDRVVPGVLVGVAS